MNFRKDNPNKSFYAILSLSIFITLFFNTLHSEEYSIRKKKSPKKNEVVSKKAPSPESGMGFSRDNNRISNLFWLEEGALFLPDDFDSPPSVVQINPELPPSVTREEIPTPPVSTKPQEENPNKTIPEKEKQNIIWQFLMENKKVLLIVSLLIIFAIYRLRGNSPTYSGQGRIFSKFRNK